MLRKRILRRFGTLLGHTHVFYKQNNIKRQEDAQNSKDDINTYGVFVR